MWGVTGVRGVVCGLVPTVEDIPLQGDGGGDNGEDNAENVHCMIV